MGGAKEAGEFKKLTTENIECSKAASDDTIRL